MAATTILTCAGHQADEHHHLPTIASEALIMATTLSPTFSPSSSAASLVIDAETVPGFWISIFTTVVTVPLRTSLTTPFSWFRALSFMGISFVGNGTYPLIVNS